MNKKYIFLIIPIIVLLFLNQMVFQGRIPLAGDTVSHQPISKWQKQSVNENENYPQWYPDLFSGMPSYGGHINTRGNAIAPLLNSVLLNRGLKYWFYFALGGLGVFAFLRRRNLNEWASVFGGLVFAITPYSFGLINAGHSSKIIAFAYLPWLLLFAEDVMAKFSLKSILLLALFTALQLWSNHPQVVYYTWMLIGFRLVWIQGEALMDKKWNLVYFSKSFGGILAGVALALIMVSDPYVSVMEFNDYSNRGESSVFDKTDETKSGASWDYATQWSFHPKETISYLYPYNYGMQNYPSRDIKSAAYWGYMPFTQSTHYFGILVLLLAILGAFLKKPSRFEWSMWAMIFCAILIGFGSYFPILFSPFFNWSPFFGKFRVPSMIYMTIPFMVSYLAGKSLNDLMYHLEDKRELIQKNTIKVFGSFIGLTIIFLLFGESFLAFMKTGEATRYNQQVLMAVREIRFSLFQKGLMLALGISGLSIAIIWAGTKRAITKSMLGVLLTFILIFDLGMINFEFLHLKDSSEMAKKFKSNPGIEFLQKEMRNEPFRIYPKDDFATNRYGYFGLESVGGYRPIKLRTYQDLMDGSKRGGQVQFSPSVQNMLNIRYIIDKGRIVPNEGYLPRAWMVDSILQVEDQKSSLMSVLAPNFSPKKQAIVLDYTGETQFDLGENRVKLTQYKENEIKLDISSEKGGLLVLSEIYYKPGWLAFVDEVETKIYQTNHVLRSVLIPEGKHKVIFRYDDSKWALFRWISRITFFGTVLFLLYLYRKPILEKVKKNEAI